MEKAVLQKIVAPDMGKSQVMPAVTVSIPMPQGAAMPAQAAPQVAPQQAGSQTVPQAAPAQAK
jgi:hypothetical protein